MRADESGERSRKAPWRVLPVAAALVRRSTPRHEPERDGEPIRWSSASVASWPFGD